MSLNPTPEAACSVQAPRTRRLETWACVLLAILVGGFYLWTAHQPSSIWGVASKTPEGYYPLETAGFRSGHLYVALAPHPALLAMADPYDPVANAPYRVHDMTLYKGHYYLYFGVTPALILFWPVAALTGRYLYEPVAVALFCSGAIWVGMGLLLAIRRRHFPAAPTAALIAGWVCLAWATPLLKLVEGPQFYQVPISCAIFLQALMLVAIYRALHSRSRALAWLCAAGVAYGLAIGARPNYLVCAAVLLIPIAAYAQAAGEMRGQRLRAFIRALWVTFLPAALCGVGLLAFNWARFGSATEFGMHYQLAGERFTALKQMSASFMVPHVIFYLTNAGFWQSYFPFFASSTGQPYGFLRYVPWTWLALAVLLRPRASEPGARPGLFAIAGAIAGASVLNLAFLSCFFGTTGRYPGDFANAWLILAGIGALALGQRLALAKRPGVFRLLAGVGAAVSLFFALLVYVGGFPKPETFRWLARAADWPAYAWQSARGGNFGGLRMELHLPEHTPVLAEPVFETGIQSDARDWLEIAYLSNNRARLNFFHAGTGTFPSHEFEIPADRRITIEARCGSLLPPFTSPVFSSWSQAEYDVARRDLQVTVNGSEVLRLALECYDSSPANLTVGRLAWFSGGMQQVFTGEILSIARLPLEKPEMPVAAFAASAPLEMSLFLPASTPPAVEPLLATGKGKESDLLLCAYNGRYHISFGLDHFGGGGPRSEPMSYDPLVPHKLVVWMGSMLPEQSGLPERTDGAATRLVVLFDGKVALNSEQTFFPGGPESAVAGRNPFNSTVAREEFTGRIAAIRQVEIRTLPAAEKTGVYGAVDMNVEFPLGALGTQEPLVVTGVSGAGDMVYLRYLDADHVSFGFDHWGIGGSVGKPVAVDYRANHRISVVFQSLFPEGSVAHASDLVRVKVDGATALEAHWACHPSTVDQISVGKNPIGGSTCGPLFTGRILTVAHNPAPKP